jgi:hypothetical protein
MNEIRRVLSIASWRLLLVDFFRTLAIAAAAAVGALILTRLAERTFGLPISWPRGWIALAAIALGTATLAALAWSLIRRARGLRLARELDERANLKESLSTALCVASSDDPWCRMVLQTARERALAVDVRKAIPITAPRLWPAPFAMTLALVAVWFSFPQLDVMGLFQTRQAALAQQNELRQVTAEVQSNEQRLKELMQQARVEIKDDDSARAAADNKPEPRDADEIRRAAVKKLTSMSEKLAEMKSGEKSKQMEALKNQMKQLKQPGPGPLDGMTKSLQMGDFKRAQEDLAELSKQMASDSMSKEDKAKAAEQLQKLAEQLEKLAQDRQQLERQLEQAGLSKEQAGQAARDPEALRQALEQMKNLSEEQKRELVKQALAQNAACKQCNGMASSMGKMAKGSSQSGMNQEGMEGLEGLSGQLSDLEMAEQDLKNLDAALSECRGQLAKMASQCSGGSCEGDGRGVKMAASENQSPWRAGETAGKFGQGSGGPGQSGGGTSPQGADAPVTTEKAMAQSKVGNGPIIGSKYVYGEQVRGESTAEFQQAVESGRKAASEALETMQVRRELHDSVKHYFGRLEARAKGQK